MGVVENVYAPVIFANDPPQRPVYVALYPLRSIVYFFTHPILWKIIICPLLITLTISIIAIVLIFGLALYPQYLLMMDICDIVWLSWIVAVILCLFEIFIVIILTVLIFFDGTKRRIYRKVFEIEGISVRRLDSDGLPKPPSSIEDFVDDNCCLWLFADFWSSIKNCLLCCFFDRKDCGWYLLMKVISLLVFIISLPLNLIPVIGTLAFCLINGTLMAWRLQLNYFKEKNLPPSVCSYILKHRMSEYASFGTVCMILDLIPLVDVLLVYTNVIASGMLIVFNFLFLYNLI